jgi:hypothetical protein
MFGNGSTGIIASAHLFGSLPSYLIDWAWKVENWVDDITTWSRWLSIDSKSEYMVLQMYYLVHWSNW